MAIRHQSDIGESPYQFSEVSVDRIQRSVADVLDSLGGFPNLVRGKRVLVKVNLVRPSKSRPAATTDPRATLALVRLLKEAGAKSVVVGENPGCGVHSFDAFRDSGTAAALEGLGVEFCYFDRDELVPVDIPNGVVLSRAGVPRTLLEAEVFVNLPKLKTHLQALVSLGIKNLHGCIPDEERNFFHRNDIAWKVVDIFRVVTPALTIIDGFWAMEGQAPFYGKPICDMGTVVAGYDTVAVDAVCSALMGIRPEEVATTMIAASEGLGCADLNAIAVVGDQIADVTRPFERPILSAAGQFANVRSIEGGVCTGCLSALRHSLDRLQVESKLGEVQPMTVYTGIPMPFRPPPPGALRDTAVLFGNCAMTLAYDQAARKQQAVVIPGCPPYIMDFHDMVVAQDGRQGAD